MLSLLGSFIPKAFIPLYPGWPLAILTLLESFGSVIVATYPMQCFPKYARADTFIFRFFHAPIIISRLKG
jgi:hypothetical protein